MTSVHPSRTEEPAARGALPASGSGTIARTQGDETIRWSSPKDYYSLKPNQIVDREIDIPDMKFVLDNFNSTKPENVVLAPGDPATAVHPFIAVGMVRKTALGMVETVTDVEWSPTKIMHKYRTNIVGGGLPCCCVNGYGVTMTVEDLGNGKTRIINHSHQETKMCPCFGLAWLCCLEPLWWDSFTNTFLQADVNNMIKKYKAGSATK